MMDTIIDLNYLKDDSIKILLEEYNLSSKEANKLLNDETMNYIIDIMYQTQEGFLQELGLKHIKEKKDK